MCVFCTVVLAGESRLAQAVYADLRFAGAIIVALAQCTAADLGASDRAVVAGACVAAVTCGKGRAVGLFHTIVDAESSGLTGFFDTDFAFGAIGVCEALGGCGACALCLDGNA